MLLHLSLLLAVALASDVDSFPKLAAQLIPGDVLVMGDEPANVTDVSLEDDGTLTVIGLGLITNEFYEKQLEQADVVDVSTVLVSEQKVRRITEDDYVELEDSEGNVTDDAEIAPGLRDKLVSALKLKQNVKATVVYSFGIRRITRLNL